MSEHIEKLTGLRDAEIRDALRELPTLEPPERAWRRLSAEVAKPTGRSAQPWAQAAGLVGAALMAGLLAVVAYQYGGERDAPAVVDVMPRGNTLVGSPIYADTYSELVAESVWLDNFLLDLPVQQGVMAARTASTIVGLGDQIALIDAHLSMSAAADVESQYRGVLWQERVDLMNALVYVRVAHAQRFEF